MLAVRLASWWMHWSFFINLRAEEISKLSKADFGISIRVDSTDDRKYLSINQTATELSKEVLDVNFSYLSDSKFVETSEDGLWAVIRLVL